MGFFNPAIPTGIFPQSRNPIYSNDLFSVFCCDVQQERN